MDNVESCGFEISSGGVWFSVLGTGDILTASTCHKFTFFEARVSVFKQGGARLCEELECVTEEDGAEYSICTGSSPQGFGLPDVTLKGSFAVWRSVDRQLYYILVHAEGNEAGPFGLTLGLQPGNGDCEYAHHLPIGYETPLGSTVGASAAGVGACGSARNDAAGVWYRLTGTGAPLTLTVTGEERCFDVSVFSGTCAALTCVSGSTRCYKTSWNSVLDETYFILISGSGSFELQALPSSNDACVAATRLQVGAEPAVHSMKDASRSWIVDHGHCGVTTYLVNPGLWFQLQANATELLQVSTCHSGTFSDTSIFLFRGQSCEDRECVTGNLQGFSDECSNGQSQLQFLAEEGRTYYLFVQR